MTNEQIGASFHAMYDEDFYEGLKGEDENTKKQAEKEYLIAENAFSEGAKYGEDATMEFVEKYLMAHDVDMKIIDGLKKEITA